MAVRCTAFIPSLAAVEAGACEEMEESNKVSHQCVGIEKKEWIMVVQEEARDKSNAAKEISNRTCSVTLGKTVRPCEGTFISSKAKRSPEHSLLFRKGQCKYCFPLQEPARGQESMGEHLRERHGIEHL